jgi:hypothetical protein
MGIREILVKRDPKMPESVTNDARPQRYPTGN